MIIVSKKITLRSDNHYGDLISEKIGEVLTPFLNSCPIIIGHNFKEIEQIIALSLIEGKDIPSIQKEVINFLYKEEIIRNFLFNQKLKDIMSLNDKTKILSSSLRSDIKDKINLLVILEDYIEVM